MGPNRPRTPKVGHRFLVPEGVLDGDAWQVAMAEVEYSLKFARGDVSYHTAKVMRDHYFPDGAGTKRGKR